MQGMPANLLTKTAKVAKGEQPAAGKNVVVKDGEESSGSPSQFSSLFSTILNPEAKNAREAAAKTKGEELLGKENKREGSKEINTQKGAHTEIAADVLLKNQASEQAAKTNIGTMTPEQAMPKSVLKNLDQLLMGESPAKTAGQEVSEKVASTANNLDQLLHTLKNNKEGAKIQGEEEGQDGFPAQPKLQNQQYQLQFHYQLKIEEYLDLHLDVQFC